MRSKRSVRGRTGRRGLRPSKQVQRLALNLEQVRALNLPPNPAKESDARFAQYLVAPRRPNVELVRTADLLIWILDHFLPLRDPAGGARHRE